MNNFKRFAALLAASVSALLMSLPVHALDGSASITLPHAPDKVWAAVGDFGSLHAWHPAVAKTDTEGDGGNGIYRTLTLGGDGGTIRELLLSYSMEDMMYKYSIIEGVLPVANYASVIKVSAGSSDNESVVEWTSTFDADGVSDDEALELMNGIYKAGLENVQKMLSGG